MFPLWASIYFETLGTWFILVSKLHNSNQDTTSENPKTHPSLLLCQIKKLSQKQRQRPEKNFQDEDENAQPTTHWLLPANGLLICTLISENQGLEKSRSASNLRKISGPADLDLFLGLHLEKQLDLYHKLEKKIQVCRT